jgi:hypothetical protein
VTWRTLLFDYSISREYLSLRHRIRSVIVGVCGSCPPHSSAEEGSLQCTCDAGYQGLGTTYGPCTLCPAVTYRGGPSPMGCDTEQEPYAVCRKYLPPAPVGGRWRLVRHLPSTATAWHPSTDCLKGTDTYGDPGNDTRAWSVPFNHSHVGEFLFASGDGNSWLIAKKSSVVWCDVCDVERSSTSGLPHQHRWNNAGGSLDGPWVSLTEWNTAISAGQILYGGASSGSWASHIALMGGMNVFVRSLDPGKCTSCPLGSSSPPGSDAATDCACNAGFTGTNGGTCTICVAGKYKGGTGNLACSDCVAGKYSGDSAATVCTDCVAGKLSAAVGCSSTCAECEAGKYSAATGAMSATTCTPCPDGSSSSAGSCFCPRALPTSYQIVHTPPEYSGSSRIYRNLAGRRRQSGLGPSGRGASISGGGDPSFYFVLDLGASRTGVKLVIRNSNWGGADRLRYQNFLHFHVHRQCHRQLWARGKWDPTGSGHFTSGGLCLPDRSLPEVQGSDIWSFQCWPQVRCGFCFRLGHHRFPAINRNMLMMMSFICYCRNNK